LHHADEIVKIVESCPVCVVGDSLGAEVGLEIAKLLHIRGLCCSCVMIDPSPPPDLAVDLNN
jgi:thioesterase domain-containing protein